MVRRARIFLNDRSGASRCSAEEVVRLFRSHGWLSECTQLGCAADLHTLVRSERPDVVFVAAGGDGTVSAVAAAVAGTERAMGVLPVGTLNHFARDLALPLDLAGSVAAIAEGSTRAVDVGEVNGLVFVNNSSIGVYPMMVLDRERMKKSGVNKWASLVVASAKSFVRFRCLQVELEAGGAVRRCITPLVFIGNNEYRMQGAKLGGRERLDGGELAVYLAPGAGRSTILRMVFAALFGRLKTVPEYQEYRVQRLTVKIGRRRLRVSLDGEVKRLRGPLIYRSRPGSLHVLVPPAAPAAEPR